MHDVALVHAQDPAGVQAMEARGLHPDRGHLLAPENLVARQVSGLIGLVGRPPVGQQESLPRRRDIHRGVRRHPGRPCHEGLGRGDEGHDRVGVDRAAPEDGVLGRPALARDLGDPLLEVSVEHVHTHRARVPRDAVGHEASRLCPQAVEDRLSEHREPDFGVGGLPGLAPRGAGVEDRRAAGGPGEHVRGVYRQDPFAVEVLDEPELLVVVAAGVQQEEDVAPRSRS